MKQSLYIVFLLIIIICSCNKDNDFGEQVDSSSGYHFGAGFFIVNEGNFNQGNGSVYFNNSVQNKVYENIFLQKNGRPLGDVPLSMSLIKTMGYIVVNNSGKIEVVELDEFLSVAAIEGFPSPRYLLQVDQEKAYVSDLKSTSMTVVDLKSNEIAGTIECGKSTDRMVMTSDKVFACNWSAYYNNEENNTISVIDGINDDFIEYIEVTKEPNSIVLDKNQNIWVLCSGGFMNEEIPALYCIDGNSHAILKKLKFPEIASNPGHLTINPAGDSLLFLNNDIFIMDLEEDAIPLNSLISLDDKVVNGFSSDPVDGKIYVYNAVNYQQNGLVHVYNRDGEFLKNIEVGIIPGYISFSQP